LNGRDAPEVSKICGIILSHLPCAGNKIVVGERQLGWNWAQYIHVTRLQGAQAFYRSESKRQISSLRPLLTELKQALLELSVLDRNFLALSILAVLDEKGQEVEFHPIEELERQIGLTLRGLAFRSRQKGLRGDRRLARERDWQLPATALACRHVWAEALVAENTSAWQVHLEKFRQRLTGSMDEESRSAAFGEFRETAAPRTANKDTPGKFAQFLQDVLNIYPERNQKNEPFSAFVALRALKSVSEASAQDSTR